MTKEWRETDSFTVVDSTGRRYDIVEKTEMFSVEPVDSGTVEWHPGMVKYELAGQRESVELLDDGSFNISSAGVNATRLTS